jgi:hypothetical protein
MVARSDKELAGLGLVKGGRSKLRSDFEGIRKCLNKLLLSGLKMLMEYMC